MMIIICTLVYGVSRRAVWLVHLVPPTQSLVIHHYIFVCVSLTTSNLTDTRKIIRVHKNIRDISVREIRIASGELEGEMRAPS